MKLSISVALAYLLSGISQVIQDLSADFVRRPRWAERPTIGNAIFAGVTWFARPFLKYMSDGQVARGVAFGLLTVVWQMGLLAGFISYCIRVSAYIFNSTIPQLATSAILIIVGGRLILPWLDLLFIPVLLVVRWPLDLLFPLKQEIDVGQIEWCGNCKHHRRSKEFEDHVKGLWRADSIPPRDKLPCNIILETTGVWERHFELQPNSRTLFPKNCPFFEKRA